MEPKNILAVDPKKIHDSKKEAVVDSLLNILNARLSGKGKYGEVIYKGKPRGSLTTGFLLPMPINERHGDEEASPIQISAHGLDFQVKRLSDDIALTVSISGCAYVRIYPNLDEIAFGGICEPNFPIADDIKKALKARIKLLLDELKASLGENAYKHPTWSSLSTAARKKAHEEFGLRFEDVEDAVPENENPENDVSKTDTSNTEATDKSDLTVRGSAALRDNVVVSVPAPQKWLRVNLDLPSFSFKLSEYNQAVAEASQVLNQSIAAQLSAWAEDKDPVKGGKAWGFRHGTNILPSDLRNWDGYLERVRASSLKPVLPTFDLRWDIQVVDDPINNNNRNIHIAIENWSDEPPAIKESEVAFFQVAITATVLADVHIPLKLDRVDPSYRYQSYLKYPALGFNGGVISELRESYLHLKTTWTPRFTQPRIIPTELENYGVEAKIRKLAEADCLKNLKPLGQAFEDWIDKTKNHPFEKGIDPEDLELIQNERARFAEDVQAWTSEKDAIKSGIAILEESSKCWSGPGPQNDPRGIPFEAWLSMNTAMAEVAERKGYQDWRLFQLAFILANISAFVTRIPEFHQYYKDDAAEYSDAVTLLYFATGGGKSEAFFGLLAFALFLDRLRGKERGVTAILRYPLRLLTLQQAQRAAKVLAQAEIVRRIRQHPGQAFTLGFWVGGSNTPNHLSDQDLQDSVPKVESYSAADESVLRNSSQYNIALERWNKLPSCPFCGSATGLRLFGSLGGALGHLCLNQKKSADMCSWNASYAVAQPLPFYIVDEDIYSFAPSVLLGTVDKLAAMGHSQKTIRKFYGLFGFSPWWDPATDRLYIPDQNELATGPGIQYKPLFPSYSDGERRFFDPLPSLMIQDEAHLLDESLGTFAGLFETALESAFDQVAPLLKDQQTLAPETNQRRRLKVIAASATVSSPERQMKSLYQRQSVVQFPHPGPSLYESFYAQAKGPDDTDFDSCRRQISENETEQRSHWGRVYQSILTNGRTHTVTMVSALANFHLTITSLYEQLNAKNEELHAEAKSELIDYLSEGPLTAQYKHSLAAMTNSELLTLVDLHRIALTYVTNKKGGDQLIDAERMEFEKQHINSGYSGKQLESELITGAIDAGRIQAVVRRAEERAKPDQEFAALNDKLRSIIATSAVSHGVDVEELNSMFFAGMPSDIAEYIQASSRVGRTHIGFCILVPTPQRARDRYIVEVHDIFHRFLERMIMPAAVDRWAENALQRVVPSFFQTYLCGVRAIQELCVAPNGEKGKTPRYAMTKDVRSAVSKSALKEKDAISSFLQNAFGLKPNFLPAGGPYYASIATTAVNEILKDMQEPRFQNTQLRIFFESRDGKNPPMTSLRDVDEPGHIVPSFREPDDSRSVKPEAMELALRFIRGGMGADIDSTNDLFKE